MIMPYPSIDSDDDGDTDIITCISSDDDIEYFTDEITHYDNADDNDDHNRNDNDEQEDRSGEIIEVVDDVEFVDETDALAVNNGDENSSVFAFEMF